MDQQTAGGGERIAVLLVEDYAQTRDVLVRLLRAEGYQAATAANAIEALAALEKSVPSLVITDFNMPGMDGLSLCRRIRSDARWQHIRVIMFSVDETVRTAALQAGADVFIQKDSMDWAILRQEIVRLIGPGTLGTSLPDVGAPGVKDAG